jgi:hypothetical protein
LTSFHIVTVPSPAGASFTSYATPAVATDHPNQSCSAPVANVAQ